MKKTTVLVAVLLVVVLFCSAAFAEFGAMVFGKKAPVYFGPSTDDEYLGSLGHMTKVTVEASSGDWALIRYKSRNGYMKVSDLMATGALKKMTIKANTGVYYITMDQFNKCNFTKKLGIAKKGQKVNVRGYMFGKVLISDKSNRMLALIDSSYLR